MIRKRTVLLILFVVISAVALGVISLKTEVLNRILKPFFEQKLGEVYKAKVDIGAIEGGIWNGFTLKRVRFTWPSANLIRSLAAAKIQTNIHMLDWIGQETSLRRSLLLNGTTFRLQKSLRIQMSPIMDYVEKVPEVENKIRNLATDSLWLEGDFLVLQNMPKQVFKLGTVFVHMNTLKDGKKSELRIFGMKPNDKEAKRFYLVEHLLHEPGEGSARFKIAGYPLKELDGLNPNIRIYSGLLEMGGFIKSGKLEEGYVEIIDFEAGFRGPDDVVQRGKFDANVRYANDTVFIEKISLIGEDVGFQVEGTIKNPAKKLKMEMDLAAKGKVGNKILEFTLKGKLKKPQVNGHFILNDEKGNPKLAVGLEGFFKKLKLRTQNMGLLGLKGKVFWGKNKEDLGKRKEKALEFSGDIFAGIDGLSFKNIEVSLLEDQIMVKGNVFPDKTLLNIMVKECMLGRFSLHGEAVLEVDSALFAQSEGWPMKFRIPWFAVNGVDVEEINAQVQYFPDEKYLKIESFQMGKGCEVKGWMDFQKNTLDLVGDFNEFRLKTFFFIAKDPEAVDMDGLVEGSVHVYGQLDYPESVSKLKLKKGRLLRLSFDHAFFDMKGSGPLIEFQNCRINDRGGYILIGGYIDFEQEDPFSHVTLGSDERSLYFMGLRIENLEEDGEVSFQKELNDKTSLSIRTPRNEGGYLGLRSGKEAELELEYEVDKDQNILIRFDEDESMMGLKRKVKF